MSARITEAALDDLESIPPQLQPIFNLFCFYREELDEKDESVTFYFTEIKKFREILFRNDKSLLGRFNNFKNALDEAKEQYLYIQQLYNLPLHLQELHDQIDELQTALVARIEEKPASTTQLIDASLKTNQKLFIERTPDELTRMTPEEQLTYALELSAQPEISVAPASSLPIAYATPVVASSPATSLSNIWRSKAAGLTTSLVAPQSHGQESTSSTPQSQYRK